MAIRAFKHLRSADLDFYAKGSFRLTTLRQMGKQESLKKLYDPMEGRVIIRGPSVPTQIRQGTDPVFEQVIGPAEGATGPTVFGFNVEVVHPDAWIWCVTQAADATIPGEDYDAIVEILDLYRLAKRIQIARPEDLGDPLISEVKYEPRDRQYGVGGSTASWFIKGPAFAPEKETRVFWPMRRPAENPLLDVVAPSAIRLLRHDGRPMRRCF